MSYEEDDLVDRCDDLAFLCTPAQPSKRDLKSHDIEQLHIDLNLIKKKSASAAFSSAESEKEEVFDPYISEESEEEDVFAAFRSNPEWAPFIPKKRRVEPKERMIVEEEDPVEEIPDEERGNVYCDAKFGFWLSGITVGPPLNFQPTRGNLCTWRLGEANRF